MLLTDLLVCIVMLLVGGAIRGPGEFNILRLSTVGLTPVPFGRTHYLPPPYRIATSYPSIVGGRATALPWLIPLPHQRDRVHHVLSLRPCFLSCVEIKFDSVLPVDGYYFTKTIAYCQGISTLVEYIVVLYIK